MLFKNGRISIKDRPVYINVLITIVLGIIVSLGINWYANLSLFDFDKDVVLEMISFSKNEHYFSFFIVFFLFVLFTFSINNMLLSTVTFSLVGFAITIANTLKMGALSEPIYPSDLTYLKNSKNLVTMIDPAKTKLLIFSAIGIVLIIVLALLINHINPIFHVFARKKQFKWRATRSAITISMLVMYFFFISGYNRANSNINKIITHYNLYQDNQSWMQIFNYQTYGLVNGLIINSPGPSISKPTHYSSSEVAKIIEKYSIVADEINLSRSRDDFSGINLITVLSESLTDPTEFEGIEIAPPLDYIIDPSDKVAVGHIVSPVYGGGTPNTEYELLTSLSFGSLNATVPTAFQSFVVGNNKLPSIFKLTQSTNHESTSIHSYPPAFFKRSQAYSSLGIETQVFMDDMVHQDHLYNMGQFISDESIYQEAIDYYQNDVVDHVIHLVTMQNHVGYIDGFPEYTFNPTSDVLSSDMIEQFKFYSEGLMSTDVATREFVDKLNTIGKPYILFFYGDHLPGIYNELLNSNSYEMRYRTNFFILTNIDDYTYSSTAAEGDTISLTNVQNMMMDIADVKMSPYQALVLKVNESFSSIHRNGYFLRNDPEIKTYDSLTPEQQELVNEYNMIQYDLIDGNAYSKDALYYTAP